MISKFVLTFELLCILVQVSSLCNKCQGNYAICHDEKRFTMCTDGIAENKTYTCPEGFVCTKKTSICLRQTKINPVTPSCQMKCGLCNSPGKLFSCLNNVTYVFCFGEDIPDASAKGVCPYGYVCNLDSSEVCKKSTEASPSCNAVLEYKIPAADSSITTLKPGVINSGYSGPTSAANEITSLKPTTAIIDNATPILSTTTLSPRDESRSCMDRQAEGVYKLENDPTCRKFILCYLLAGQYLELRFTCSGSDFFNEETKDCQIEKPAYC